MGDADQRDPEEALFLEYGDKLAAYVGRRIRSNSEAASEIVAKIWLKTFENWPGHDHPERFLFLVAKRTIIDWYKAVRPVQEPYDELAELTISGPVNCWSESQDPGAIVPPRLDLDKAIRSLPQRMQMAFILTVVDDLPCEIVAAIMGIGCETVRTQVARAREKLQVHESLIAYMPIR